MKQEKPANQAETDFYAAELDSDNLNEDLDYTNFYHYELVVGSEPRSGHWQTVRKHHIEAHNTCAACGCKEHLQVHHVEPFHINPEKELDPTNLITLCMVDTPNRRCHFVLGHHNNWKNSNPTVRAEASKRLETFTIVVN